MASYKDILLAHIPSFTDRATPLPGVQPLRFEDVTIRQLKRRARGTAPSFDPGSGGAIEDYVPLSVRIERASKGSDGALRAKPFTLGLE